MTILIAGGMGFIGTNLTLKLLNDNNIVIVDNFSTSNRKTTFSSNVTIIDGDICDKSLVDNIFDLYKFTEVYNLACPASPVWYQKYPLETIKVNTYGLINLLDNSLKYHSKILHASTSEIYGDPLYSPQDEKYYGNVNTLGSRSCYNESKRLAETICYEYNKKGTDIRLIRIFNTYGPYMQENDGRVISNFIVKCLKNEPIEVYGDGKQTRSFQYIDDLLSGIEKVMELKKVDAFGPINLGNPDEWTINDLATLIVTKLNSKSTITYLPENENDPKQRKPDITKAINLLNWKPIIDIHTGLDNTIKYFK